MHAQNHFICNSKAKPVFCIKQNQECVSGIRVVSQPFCVDQLNPAGLISVRATLPTDQVSSLQRRVNELN